MMFTQLQLLSVHYPSCDGCARDVEESRMQKEFGRKKRSQGKTERHLYQNMFLWMKCFSFVRVQYTRTGKVYGNLLLIDVINVFAYITCVSAGFMVSSLYVIYVATI